MIMCTRLFYHRIWESVGAGSAEAWCRGAGKGFAAAEAHSWIFAARYRRMECPRFFFFGIGLVGLLRRNCAGFYLLNRGEFSILGWIPSIIIKAFARSAGGPHLLDAFKSRNY